MKRMVCALCAVVCALVLAVSAMAQVSNVTGDWDVMVNDTGNPHKAKASFKQEGEKLTGVIRSQSISLGREMRLEGVVRGKQIRFTYILYIADMIMTLTLSGAVEGDSMKGDVYLGGPYYGQPAGETRHGAYGFLTCAGLPQEHIYLPPVTSINAPVEYEACSESSHRIAFATSMGCPPRFIGTSSLMRSTRPGSPPLA